MTTSNLIRLVAGVGLLVLFPATGVAEKPGYKAGKVSGGGSVEGTVSFSGARPESSFKTINKDPEICGTGQREYDKVLVSDGGQVAEAVVFIDEIAEGKAWQADISKKAKIVQKGCTFLPESYVVRKGDELHVFNKDKVMHNIHSYEMAGEARITMWNSGQPAGSDFKKAVRMRRSGSHGIKLECDAHNFMHANMFAADNPYFAVTGADGKFEIGDIPAGKYALVVWHPILGTQKAEIEITGGVKSQQAFTFEKK